MSIPLEPRSPQSLNCMATQTPPRKSSPLKNLCSPRFSSPTPQRQTSAASSGLSGTPSSPFESDVGIGQENVPPPQPESVSRRSPTKNNMATPAPMKEFDIFDEEEDKQQHEAQATSTFDFSPIKQGNQAVFESSKSAPSKGEMRDSPVKSPPPASPEEQLATESASADCFSRTCTENDDDAQSAFDAASFVSDDTRFSAFSAIPNADMTLFAKLGNRSPDNTQRSPVKQSDVIMTPCASVYGTPRTSHRKAHSRESRSPSPTPRKKQPPSSCEETTSLLLDFTQQFEGAVKGSAAYSPSKRAHRSPTKSTTEPNLLSFINNQRMPSPNKSVPATPGGTRRSMLNLLDFDLPPQPTPRSIPTITVRELETLKSSYLSEISSLKASLSGREAEVDSLKKAVTDAERRVGEALENVREERSTREHAEKEKMEWEKKGREVESVLKSVKEEYLQGEREKEELVQKLDEANRLREEAEIRAVEAATRASIPNSHGSDGGETAGTSATESLVAQRVAQQIDEKMENLARELHGVYKKKHETKVATLKKTYEARSEKRCADLQSQIDELTRQNEELQSAKDATFSGELPSEIQTTSTGEPAGPRQLEEHKTEIREQQAKIAGLAEELKSVRENHAQLLQDLEHERIEKGELVAAVDEMLALQSEIGAPSAIEDFRRSISRPPSSLGRPSDSSGASRIGRPGSGLPSLGGGGRSNMMNKLQRMGSGRGD